MSKIFKNQLRPPFVSHSSGAVLNSDGIVVVINYGTDLVELSEFVAAALNEKCERDFGEKEAERHFNDLPPGDVLNRLDVEPK